MNPNQEPWQEAALPGTKRKRKLLLVLAVLAGLLAAGVAGGAYTVHRLLEPMPSGAETTVVIPPGVGSGGIASMLEAQGVIRSAAAFRGYLKYNGEGTRFQAGTYVMAPGMTYDQVIAKLNAGDTVKEETIRFTVPEGFTVLQIADRLQEQGIADRDAFLAAAAEKEWLDHPLLADLPDDPLLKQRLEGYLFPETYEFKKDSTERDMIRRMVEETDRKLAALPADWRDKLAASGLTWHQLLTVASLIEREVVVEEERPIVAGIIYRRLQADMPLQIDATVQYAMEKPKERLLHVDLQLESPYNTYLHGGLPPGPIATPGLASIQAALYPQETEYLFYVTKKDGSRKHLFAKTFAEHQKNIRESQKNASSGGTS